MSLFNITTLSTIPNRPADWFRQFLIFIFLLILIIGVIGNSLVLLSIRSNPAKLRRSSTNLLLVNMSCADLLILIFNIFDIVQFAFDPFWPTAWYFGLALCKIVRFAQVFGCYVSVQTLLVISIERYISIIDPIKISSINHRYFIFILIWSLGLIIALPNLYLLKLHPFQNRPHYYICGLSDHRIDSYLIIFYKYTESLCFFFLPAFIQTILYIIICRKIFLLDRAVQAQSNDHVRRYSEIQRSFSSRSPFLEKKSSLSPTLSINHGNVARKKAIIMLVIVATFYFIAFSPSQINFIYTQINQSHHLYEHRLFFLITILLALSSTAFNPILFYIFSKFFRYRFNILLRRICPWCRPRKKDQNDIPMS